jgi:flavin reductase (DIM6/NTAB) family NADH-FMN oxidoreductase RutF/rubredoxin
MLYAMDMKTFFDMSYGLFVLGVVKEDGKPTGCTVNTVFQLTSEPATLAISLNRQNYTYEVLKKSGRVAVNILDQSTPMDLIGTFGFHSGRDTDKFAQVAWHTTPGGLPILDSHLCGWMECRVKHTLDLSTHTLFVVEVEDALRVGNGAVPPMTYEYYRVNKNGTVPKTAPHYIAPEKLAQDAPSKTWVCPICKYRYDGSQGPFENLPDDWKCPLCGAPKSAFVLEES